MIDTFQRYLFVYNFIKQKASKEKKYKILDVGPNGPGLARYIPEFENIELVLLETREFTEAEKQNFPNVRFVTYDGFKAPSKEKQFDLVTCIDTFEHIPHEQRESFIKELGRVAKKDIIMSFPLDHSEPFEKILRMMFLNKIKFLDEHKEYGLPNEKEFRQFTKKNKLQLISTDNNLNVYLWIPVKLFSSLLYRLVDGKENLTFKLFKIYSRGVYKLFAFGKPYSKTFLIHKK